MSATCLADKCQSVKYRMLACTCVSFCRATLLECATLPWHSGTFFARASGAAARPHPLVTVSPRGVAPAPTHSDQKHNFEQQCEDLRME